MSRPHYDPTSHLMAVLIQCRTEPMLSTTRPFCPSGAFNSRPNSTLQQHVNENRHSAQSTDHYPSPAPYLQGISPRGKIVGFLRRRVTQRGWTTKLTEGK